VVVIEGLAVAGVQGSGGTALEDGVGHQLMQTRGGLEYSLEPLRPSHVKILSDLII
jgi:hypothetical protein